MEEGESGEKERAEVMRRLEEEIEEFRQEEDDEVMKIWKQEEKKVEELKKREEEQLRILLASARTEAAMNVGRTSHESEDEQVRKLVESAKSEAAMNKALFENAAPEDEEIGKKKSQDMWRWEEEKVKALKEREEERVRILVASAKTQAAKNIERASAESEERLKKKIAQHEAVLSLLKEEEREVVEKQ